MDVFFKLYPATHPEISVVIPSKAAIFSQTLNNLSQDLEPSLFEYADQEMMGHEFPLGNSFDKRTMYNLYFWIMYRLGRDFYELKVMNGTLVTDYDKPVKGKVYTEEEQKLMKEDNYYIPEWEEKWFQLILEDNTACISPPEPMYQLTQLIKVADFLGMDTLIYLLARFIARKMKENVLYDIDKIDIDNKAQVENFARRWDAFWYDASYRSQTGKTWLEEWKANRDRSLEQRK